MFKISLSPSGKEFSAQSETTILDSAEVAGIKLEHSCKDGSCGTCKAKLLSGTVSNSQEQEGISEYEIKEGFILTCCTQPCSDISIEANYFPELEKINRAIQPCRVSLIDFPVDNIAILQLRLSPAVEFLYRAGQYIDLILNNIRRSYSIANTYNANNILELHIKKVPNGIMSEQIFEQLKSNQLLRVDGPIGTFFVRESQAPIIFVAGGTGIAPVKAMVEELLANNTKRQIFIYWGVSGSQDLYSDLPMEWQQANDSIKYTPVIACNESDWKGKTGYVHKAVLDDFKDLSNNEVYACGSINMILSAKAEFIQKGLNPKNFFSDAFLPTN